MVLRNVLYIITAILVIGWLLGFFYFKTSGNLIHILIVLAVISAAIAVFKKNEID